MKPKNTLYEKYCQIQKIGTEVEVPFHVWRCFSSDRKQLSIAHADVCLGEDFVSIEGARAAVAWYVTQLGGTVKWD